VTRDLDTGGIKESGETRNLVPIPLRLSFLCTSLEPNPCVQGSKKERNYRYRELIYPVRSRGQLIPRGPLL